MMADRGNQQPSAWSWIHCCYGLRCINIGFSVYKCASMQSSKKKEKKNSKVMHRNWRWCHAYVKCSLIVGVKRKWRESHEGKKSGKKHKIEIRTWKLNQQLQWIVFSCSTYLWYWSLVTSKQLQHWDNSLQSCAQALHKTNTQECRSLTSYCFRVRWLPNWLNVSSGGVSWKHCIWLAF